MNCDTIAPYYRWLEYAGMGRTLERRRKCFLDELANVQRALALGDGDGRFLAELVSIAPQARIDCVDLSRKMLDLARARAGEARVAYYQADARGFEFPVHEYDLITAHFFFDCFEPSDLGRLIHRVTQAAQPRARWIVSEFRIPNSPLAVPARIFIRGLYLFFAITTGLKTRTLTDHHALLRESGFSLLETEASWFGLVVSELWQLSEQN